MYLWTVSLVNKFENKTTYLAVPGNSADEATNKLCGIGLLSINAPYKWLGTGPAHDKDGKRIMLDAD